MKQAEFKRLYNEKDWPALQMKVASTNYKLDLSYLYLGFAAEGMGYSDASKLTSNKQSRYRIRKNLLAPRAE